MGSVVCPVRLDEVNGIENVVFDVFWGEQSHMRSCLLKVGAGGFEREAV